MKQTGELGKYDPRIEKQKLSHLLVMGIYTVFSILFIAAILIQSWEKWMIPLIIFSIIIIWVIYIGQFLTEAHRISFYTCLMLLEFFIYGAHKDTFFDLPIIMFLLIIVLLSFRKMALIYIAACTYGLEILYHICFFDTFKNISIFSASRLLLDIAAIVSSIVLSKFLLDQRQLERQQTDKALMILEAANRRSEDFLANVSHELRTPINAVIGISDILLQQELLPDLHKNIFSIQQAGRRLAVEINNILDYTDLMADRQSASNEDYMISSSINDILVMAAVQNETHGLELVFDVDSEIPSVLIGDEAKIRRVMNILLENAIKFTETGGIYVHIGCRKTPYGINLNIQIQDTGIGMNEIQLSQIYHHFYQVDSGRDRKAGGLGLGLPIAHGLIHAMGGFINIVSEPEKGTQIQISIPQEIGNESPCMTLCSPSSLTVVCYFGLESYSGEVREYYKHMLRNFRKNLNLNFHIVHQISEFHKLLNAFHPTHVFITQEEYTANPNYYREMGKDIFVTVIAEDGFEFSSENNTLFLLHKPFCAFSIVNILNKSKYHTNFSHNIISSEKFSYKGVKILVVDDDQMNLLVAKGIFSSYGMEVDTCLGGEAALKQCLLVRYDAVFLDHMMPGMDGVETLKRLRALKSGIYQSIPIVALTANAVNGAREMFKSEGFDEFVAKPIERFVLERVLRRILPGKCTQIQTSKTDHMPESPDSRIEKSEVQESLNTSAPAKPDISEDLKNLTFSDSSLDRLKAEGFDVKTGISYCTGSEEFYLEMLQNFCNSSTSKQAEITAYHKSGNWENYVIKVHALKSSSRTIGANELSACAASLEQAGKDKNMAYIEENHPKLIRLYETCCKQIRACIDTSIKESPDTAAEVPEEIWQTSIKTLSAALQAFNGFQAESAIKELSGYARHGHPCSQIFQTLAGYIDDFDFESAGSELCRLTEEEDTL